MFSPALLIIALSARPFVVAAVQAGFKVSAIDGFADSQTQAMASLIKVAPFDNDGFQAAALLAIIDTLDTSRYIGFVYGSGFEAQPALLAEVAKRMPLLGNLPTTLASVKCPRIFFSACARLGVAHPQTWTQVNANLPLDGLVKAVGASGGSHVQPYSNGKVMLDKQHYAQQKLHGLPVSVLFLAYAQQLVLVGFNELMLAPTLALPYRYGGVVSQIDLTESEQNQLLKAAQQLTAEFSLLGLNSLDAVLQDGVAYVLEVNPRLSASVGLYETVEGEMNLLAMHVAACKQTKSYALPSSVAVKSGSVAQAVIYSALPLSIPANFAWPEWVQDCPSPKPSVQMLAGQPVCTVLASADKADAAKQLLAIRVKMLNNLLANRLKEEDASPF
ncbi:COG2232 Predicted ATP-dependent carboligase related to biotin carboxylase [Methylophilaceae bacterium]